jgi:hypothetical protein
LCRKGKFAPTLREGSKVVYITNKSWKIAAILQIHKRFEKHQEAADWYNIKSLPLPSNCMVPKNQLIEIDKTIGLPKNVSDLS